MLIRATTEARFLHKIAEYLGHIAVDSPNRSEAELAAGQTLWTGLPRHRNATRKKITPPPRSGRRWPLKHGSGWNREIRRRLQAGDEVTLSLIAATFSLAQMSLEHGQAEKAVEWLDDPRAGAHTFLQNPITASGMFRVETFKLTLRAYLATRRVDAMKSMFSGLGKIVQGPASAPIYAGIGRQLEEASKRFREEGDTADAEKIVCALDLVLTRLATQPTSEVTSAC